MAEQASDTVLLERFAERREEAAFLALVERHGPLVQGTCRRVLRNEHDVEDVFQATFLVLARKAARISWRGSVGSWLCAVAHRLALGARADLSRHRKRETTVTALARRQALAQSGHDVAIALLPEKYHPSADPLVEVERRDLRRLLDDELLHLPEKYRAPVVLCYLEGKTHEEAARQLGWPAGSMSRRLERARALLRRRLAHRRTSLAIGLLTFALAVLAAWTTAPIGRRATPGFRLGTACTKAPAHSDRRFEALLGRIARGETWPRRQELRTLARQTGQGARRIDGHDPGRQREAWQLYSDEMKQWALRLTEATEQNDESAMLCAVRRLETTCVRCHELFREQRTYAPQPSSATYVTHWD